MTLTQVTNHVAQGLAKLLYQFRGKPKLEALITSYINQIQELETSGFQLLGDRWLDTAVGAQLDGFGEIVGEERQGRYDEDYRLAIRARILLNLCQGTPEDIIELFIALTDGLDVRIDEYFPAALVLTILDALPTEDSEYRILIDPNTGDVLLNPLTGNPIIGEFLTASELSALLAGYLQEAKPAGVLAHLNWYTSDNPKKFDTSGQGFDKGYFTGAD